jgi:hypothetical protein
MTVEIQASSVRTLVGALAETLADATSYNRAEMTPPAVVLWPDKEGQWEKLVPLLRAQMEQLLTLGNYDPASRSGPGVWIKCAVARKLPESTFAADATPIVYLPGISRSELRAVEDCLPALQPLAELQYRGVWFTQPNAKDWTVLAFLCSESGLGLDVARDTSTIEALEHTLLQLARTPLDRLTGKTITYQALVSLVHDDPVRAILGWMDQQGVREGSSDHNPDSWKTFRVVCKEFGFDPVVDGRIEAAQRLGRRDGKWAQVWARFAEAPHQYIHIVELLRQAQPKFKGDLFEDRSSWPRENEAAESSLRDALLAVAALSHHDAVKAVVKLESEHAERRTWVWAKLGLAPLAGALQHLAGLAKNCGDVLAGPSCEELAASYRDHGWQVDAASIDALAAVSALIDEQAVRAAVRALYLPWLERNAERLQQLMERDSVSTNGGKSTLHIAAGTCLLFVDGMRYDVGRRFAKAVRSRGWELEEGWRWAALPSVTATAKPAVSPVADEIRGGDTGADFVPHVASSTAQLSADRFHQLLSERGIESIPRSERGKSSGRGWTEVGDLDRRGHDEGARMARRVKETVDDIVARVEELLDAGWQRVQLVTDHGWLLVPGGLPKVNLPSYLAASRWGRCAALKQNSKVEVPVVPWYWNPDVRVALAPGVGVFMSGREYSHGGATLQECVVPELVVTRKAAVHVDARIASIEWVNMRCKVIVEGAYEGCRADIRTKPNDSSSSVVTPKAIPTEGHVSLLVGDDSLDQCAAVVVLLDVGGRVVAKLPTTIGG